jgi:hypothetical protein
MNISLHYQTLPRSDEYKEEMRSAVKRTQSYAARAPQASDAVITENICSAASSAGWQVNVAGSV